MENMTRSSDAENPGKYHLHQHQYSELLKVPVKDWNVKEKYFIKVEKEKDDDDDNVALEEEIKFVKGMKHICAWTLYDRVRSLCDALKPKKSSLFLCMTKLDLEADEKDKWNQDFQSTNDFFDEQSELKNIHVLVDLAGTELKNIKAFNSKTLEAGNLKEVALHEISNQYSSFYKGVCSLRLKVQILRFHLTRGRETTLVHRFSASLEGKIRQYEVELEITRFIVFQLIKNKFGLRWPRWLPDSWNKAILSARLNRRTKNTRIEEAYNYN